MSDKLGEQVAALARRIGARLAGPADDRPAPPHIDSRGQHVVPSGVAMIPPSPSEPPPAPAPPTGLPPGTGARLAELRAAVPTDDQVVDRLVLRQSVGPDADVDRLVQAITAPHTGVDRIVDVPDRPFVPLHVREWRQTVDRLIEDMRRYAPNDSPFGVVIGSNAVMLAVAALHLAAEQVTPPRPVSDRGIPEPDELVHLHALIGDLHDRVAALVAASQQQLVDAFHAAQAGQIAGPPGSTAVDEIAGVMTSMLDVSRAATGSARDSAIAAERLGRLRRAQQ